MTIDERIQAQDAPTVRVPAADTLTLGTEYLTMCAEFLNVDRLTVTPVAEDDPDAPFDFVVYDPESGDILGAGDSPDEAAEDAWATVRGWR